MNRLRQAFSRTPLQLRSRALAKTLLYRVAMVVITVVVALFFTGNLTDAINIGIATNAIKTLTYYSYERIWDYVAWGVTATHGSTHL